MTEAHISSGTRTLMDDVTMVFPTPLLIQDWSDPMAALNEALRRLILDEAARMAGVTKSNVGGWHSTPDFLAREDPPIRAVFDRVRRLSFDLARAFMPPGDYRFRVEGWANLLRAGDYNGVHNHPNATWSGVYYVTGNRQLETARSALAGKLEFFDPRPGATMSYSVDNALQRRCLFNPEPCAAVIFPSFLQHMVHPYSGVDERISIAFNITIG